MSRKEETFVIPDTPEVQAAIDQIFKETTDRAKTFYAIASDPTGPLSGMLKDAGIDPSTFVNPFDKVEKPTL